jgi:anti-anti-sigma regulatory factor
MPHEIQTEAGRVTIALSGDVTIGEAHSIAECVSAAIVDADSVELRAGGVREIDTCVLQLLVSLRNTVSEFHIAVASDELRGMVERCGLTRELTVEPPDREGARVCQRQF